MARRQVAGPTGLLVLLLALLLLSPASALPPTPHSAKHDRAALQKLTVAVPGSLAGYGRPKFGSGWTTTAGCDSREQVLKRDGKQVTTGMGCRITSGRWRSVYDAKVIRSASKLDIDHIVPLAET